MNMYKNSKRFSDIILSIILLVLLSPLFLIIIILLPFFGEGEIFFGQKRIGLNNKPFRIMKFATMLKNSAQIGTGSITVRNDYRVTSIGKYLRITKINELPQLINILIGEMSFVGPRPLMEVDFNRYPEEIRNLVYLVKPGLTGIGSIIFRDEQLIITKSTLPPSETYKEYILPYKGALEVWYQRNAGILTDLKIFLLTFWCLIFPGTDLPHKSFSNLPEREKFHV